MSGEAVEEEKGEESWQTGRSLLWLLIDKKMTSFANPWNAQGMTGLSRTTSFSHNPWPTPGLGLHFLNEESISRIWSVSSHAGGLGMIISVS